MGIFTKTENNEQKKQKEMSESSIKSTPTDDKLIHRTVVKKIPIAEYTKNRDDKDKVTEKKIYRFKQQ